jgi:hypothetical protein
MPLSSGSPPSQSTKVFHDWVTRLHSSTKGKSGPKQGHLKKVLPPVPQRVFVLTISQVLAGEGIRKAKPVAWRHFRSGPSVKQNISAEILMAGNRHLVARTYGSRASSIVTKALRGLAKKHKKYEGISLVKIPPLVGLAVWVRGRNAKEDVIFPLESVVPELQRGTAHLYVEVLPLLQRSANALVSQSLTLDAILRKGRA